MASHIALLCVPMGNDHNLTVAVIGKAVGFKGEAKLHLECDFPEQFAKGRAFTTGKYDLTIQYYHPDRGVVKFVGIDSIEDLQKFVNQPLLTTQEESRQRCRLAAGEYFWFDIIGLDVYEDDQLLGRVDEIERMAGTDMLLVQTAQQWVDAKLARSFLIPYLDRYILKVDQDAKRVIVRFAKDLLEAS